MYIKAGSSVNGWPSARFWLVGIPYVSDVFRPEKYGFVPNHNAQFIPTDFRDTADCAQQDVLKNWELNLGVTTLVHNQMSESRGTSVIIVRYDVLEFFEFITFVLPKGLNKPSKNGKRAR